MSIKFRDPLSAQACVLVSFLSQSLFVPEGLTFLHQKMDGRFFSGRRIEASLYSGRQRFKRSGAGGDDLEGGEAEAEKRRLDEFANWLMTEDD